MLRNAKKLLIMNKLRTKIIRNNSGYNFNNSIRIYDHDNNLIKYSYDNSNNSNNNKEFYKVDYINNTLSLKTDIAQSKEDFNKINSLIDFYKQKNNIIKLNNPNISNILINDELYYKNNILYIFKNITMENYYLLDRLFNKTNKTNNNFLIKSYKINTSQDMKDLYYNFNNIINIFAKKFLMYNKYNSEQLHFNCSNIIYPIIPIHIKNNMGIVDYRFINFKYNNLQIINTINDYNKLIEHLDYINDVLRHSYSNHCSLICATTQHRFNIRLSGSDDLINKVLNKETEDKLKLFNNSFIDQNYTTCFRFFK
jgi:hypothetical protein